MRRQHLELAERRDAQLHARAAELLAVDPLLDDPRRARRASRCTCRRSGSRFEPIPRSLSSDGPVAVGARRGQPGEVDAARCPRRRPLRSASRSPARHRGLLGAQPAIASTTSSRRRQVLRAERMRHAVLGEQPPAAALGPEVEEPRVGAVHRDAEREREVALELRRVVRHEMRRGRGRGSGRGSARAAAAARAASPTAAAASRRAARRGRAGACAWHGMTPGSRSR